MVRHAHHRSKTAALPPHTRRRLSEEGRRLLRHALSHDDDDSVDFSVVSNRGDTAADSDLEGFPEWQQPPTNGITKKPKKRSHLKDLYDDEDGVDADAYNALDAALDLFSEKRDATKIQALQAILRVLCGRVVHGKRLQFVAKAIAAQALATLKTRGLKDSGTLALRVLAVLAVTLGPDEQPFFESVRQPLRRLIEEDSHDPALRMEAAYALSIASYVCCREDTQRWVVLDVIGAQLVTAKDADDNGDFEDAFTEELLVALIECWAFLVSGFHPSIIVPKISDPNDPLYEHVEALAGFVREAMNPAVRSAVCEALALLVQDKYIVGKTLWNYAMEETNGPLGGLESKIQRYMHETAKSIGKKNRKTQRSMLKEVLETLRSGEGPHNDLSIGDETLSVSTWSRFFQASVFRRALQSGFQIHLHENAVLRDVFDVSDNTNVKISMVSTVRRRADHRSKTINKRNDMSRKDARQNAFLYDD